MYIYTIMYVYIYNIYIHILYIQVEFMILVIFHALDLRHHS